MLCTTKKAKIAAHKAPVWGVLGLQSVVDVAFHFWKAGLLREDVLDMVQYDVSTRHIDSSFYDWIALPDGVSQPSPEKLVYFTDGDLKTITLPE